MGWHFTTSHGRFQCYLLTFPIAADRDGDWESRLKVIQRILPMVHKCDSINYLLHASWYLGKMRMLPADHPEVNQKFTTGHFVV